MWPFSQWTTAGRAALTYITIGAFTVIWAVVWYGYLFNNPGAGNAYYWCTGFLVMGLIMILIGSVVGWIGRSAGSAPLPPAQAPMAILRPQPNGTTTPAPVVADIKLTPSGVPSNGQAMLVPLEKAIAGKL